MPGYLTNKSPLFVKVHSMQKGFITDEDLVGLGDDPDLISDLSVRLVLQVYHGYHSYL
jgi:hypothetical protein